MMVLALMDGQSFVSCNSPASDVPPTTVLTRNKDSCDCLVYWYTVRVVELLSWPSSKISSSAIDFPLLPRKSTDEDLLTSHDERRI